MSRPGLELWGPVGRWVFLNWPRGSWQYDLICALIIAGLFVFPTPQHGDLPPLGFDEVLEKIAEADAALDSFTADMMVTEHFVLFDDTEVERGTLAFLKPDLVRREVVEPALRTEVLGGGLARIYVPRIRQAQFYPVDTSPEGRELVVPGMASASELQAAYDVSLEEVTDDQDGARVYVLRLLPHAGTEAAKHWSALVLWVREGQWHPADRIILEGHNGDTTTIELSNVVRNADLEPGDFELDLADGVEIIRHGPGPNVLSALDH